MNRVFIFEDTYFDLEAIKAILIKIPETQVVGEASTLVDALTNCPKYNPNLIIADSDIHGDKTAGPTFVRSIKKVLPEVRILGMTRYADCIDPLRRAGCDYVVNKSLIENFEAAVKYLRETILPRPQFFVDLQPPNLNKAEEQVLRLICEGYTEDQIANEMNFDTRKPVRRIKNSLFNKFGAVNVPNLVHLAYKTGFLDPGDE